MNLPSESQPVCSCKGIRTCLFCEKQKTQTLSKQPDNSSFLYYCPRLNAAIERACSCTLVSTDQSCISSPCVTINGIRVIDDFITKAEEETVLNGIAKYDWVDSQSGRRKQDFGPKVNFKKQKVRLGEFFQGLPTYIQPVLDRMRKTECLDNFLVAEMCCLEYCASRGSSIDPHIDDAWLWGERLVTLNLHEDTWLTLSRESGSRLIKIPLRSRSLLILSDDARYEWMHSISRLDIKSQRQCITLRELTPQFLLGGKLESLGCEIIRTASHILNDDMRH